MYNKTIQERLGRLRELMAREGLSAYIIPTTDFHSSEYIGDYFKTRRYMCGFTGSAGTLVILPDEAGLWTDGRYFIQAAVELEGTGVTLYRSGEEGVPDMNTFLRSKLSSGAALGFDGRTMKFEQARGMLEKLAGLNLTVVYDKDLVGEIWEGRPALSRERAYLLDMAYAGENASDKLGRVRGAMREKGADAHIICRLDDIAWLFNIRGADVAYNPVALAYAVIETDRSLLFTDKSKFTNEMISVLEQAGATIMPYDEIYHYVARYGPEDTVLIEAQGINYALYKSLRAGKVIFGTNPSTLFKAVKNRTEIENLRRCHIQDGLAVTRFMRWLKARAGKESITEKSAERKLDEFRLQGEGCVGLSFNTISAYGANAAQCHYSAPDDGGSDVEPRGFLLVDSGGQYLLGTTDITRTIAVGPLTSEEKSHFTLVARCMLNLMNAKFLHGCNGYNLDVLARLPLWEAGLDYKHGTGHGVGYFLNVHEGPNSFRWQNAPGTEGCALEEGMVTTDEPGIYIEGSHGIRTENELLCIKGEKNEYGQFMYFENLTFAPIDLDAIDVNALSGQDRARLNDYHRTVYETLSPFMEQDEREWLRTYTRSV